MNRRTYIQEIAAIQRRYEVKYFPKVKAAIQAKIDEVITVMKRDGLRAAQSYLSVQVNHDELTAVVWGMVNEVALRFARRQWREFLKQKRRVKGFGFNAEWVAWVRKFLYEFIVEKITFDVFRTMKDVLNKTLDRAITEGWGVDRTVQQLAELDIPGWQSARIVRTEITRATNAGTAAASETFPYQQQKEWISAHDNRVRGMKPKDHASHIGLDGQVVDYEGVFIDPRNKDQLRWPGDPKAKAESTINCRCTHAVTAKLTEDGDFIPKRETELVADFKDFKPMETDILISEIKNSFDSVLGAVNKLRWDESDNQETLKSSLTKKVGESIQHGLERVEKSNTDILNVVYETQRERKQALNDLSDRIEAVISGIKGIVIKPEVKVSTNQQEVIESLEEMKEGFIKQLNELKESMKPKPRAYKLEFQRDKNGLLKSPINIVYE